MPEDRVGSWKKKQAFCGGAIIRDCENWSGLCLKRNRGKLSLITDKTGAY